MCLGFMFGVTNLKVEETNSVTLSQLSLGTASCRPSPQGIVPVVFAQFLLFFLSYAVCA